MACADLSTEKACSTLAPVGCKLRIPIEKSFDARHDDESEQAEPNGSNRTISWIYKEAVLSDTPAGTVHLISCAINRKYLSARFSSVGFSPPGLVCSAAASQHLKGPLLHRVHREVLLTGYRPRSVFHSTYHISRGVAERDPWVDGLPALEDRINGNTR